MLITKSLELLTCSVLAVTLPETFTLIDFVKSLELGSTPVHTPPTHPPPTSSPMVPSLTLIIRLPPFVAASCVVSKPAFNRLPFVI